MTWVFILIALLPFTAFLLLALFGRRIEDQSHRLTIPALFLSFLLSLIAFYAILKSGPIRLDLYTFIDSGKLKIDLGLYLDQLSVLLLLLVTGVSTLVHIFSSRYMQGDPRYARFFAVMSLFTFSMLMLTMSTNLFMLYLFWEIMGICSYLLISHWAENRSSYESAMRVFLVNAAADIGLGLGLFLTFATFETLDIQQILGGAETKVGHTVNLLGWLGLQWNVEVLTLIALLLFLGAMGKSAQFPFHIWLPFAMEAPTPVSALIHAATLVKAGVFLVLRMSPLFILSPAAMNVMITIGAITAFLGATVALTQTDIKRTLAYSTMSQLGLMMLACGAGAFIAATFHLLAHGALKAFLFLSAGSALQHLEGAPHLEKEKQRKTWLALPFSTLISAFSLAWLSPVLIALSGYGMLWFSSRSNGVSPLFWFIVLGTVFLTALHLSRGFNRVINNKMIPAWLSTSSDSSHSPRYLGLPGLGPAVLIATIATLFLTGALAWTWNGFTTFLYPAIALSELPPRLAEMSFFTMMLIVVGIGAALLGLIFSQFNLYGFIHGSPKRLGLYKRFYVLTHNKWYIDEICDTYIVRPNLRFSRWLWEAVDIRIIERFILVSGDSTVSFARWLWKSVDVRIIGRMIEGTAGMTVGLARWLWTSVDIRVLGILVEGTAKLTQRTAGWLWRSVDIRWLDRFVHNIGKKNEAAGQTLREIEPSMLQHQLLVIIFSLVAAMILFLIFFL